MVLRIGATTIELVEAESTQSSTPVRRALGKETSIDLVAELALADVDRPTICRMNTAMAR